MSNKLKELAFLYQNHLSRLREIELGDIANPNPNYQEFYELHSAVSYDLESVEQDILEQVLAEYG